MKRKIIEELESGKLFYMEYAEGESKPLPAVLEITPEQYKEITDARRRQDLTEQERAALYYKIIFCFEQLTEENKEQRSKKGGGK